MPEDEVAEALDLAQPGRRRAEPHRRVVRRVEQLAEHGLLLVLAALGLPQEEQPERHDERGDRDRDHRPPPAFGTAGPSRDRADEERAEHQTGGSAEVLRREHPRAHADRVLVGDERRRDRDPRGRAEPGTRAHDDHLERARHRAGERHRERPHDGRAPRGSGSACSGRPATRTEVWRPRARRLRTT